jgi:hypothetical protein
MGALNVPDFEDQKKRDIFKKKRCEEEGVRLVIIPHEYNYKNEKKLYEYIKTSIEEQIEI